MNENKTLNLMIIPNTAKRDNETNEECFLRIIDTFMGEYEVETVSTTDKAACGDLLIRSNRMSLKSSFPVVWAEDENENITEYWVSFIKGGKSWCRHETIEV